MMNSSPHITKSDGASAPSTIAPALPVIVASWPRNSRETLQVKLDQYQGRHTIDCRTWYPGADGDLKPGKGLTLSVAHLPALAAALSAALARACELGLVEGGGDGQT